MKWRFSVLVLRVGNGQQEECHEQAEEDEEQAFRENQLNSNKEENKLWIVFASTFDITNSELVAGVTSIEEIVDSFFSKNITLPMKSTDIIDASIINSNGNLFFILCIDRIKNIKSNY